MKEKVYITNSELIELLKDETQEKEVVSKYFEVDNSNAFNTQYKLKSHIVLKEEIISKSFSIKETALSVVNYIARKSRYRAYKASVEKYPNRIKIVSEGDSWFQHPHPKVHEIIHHLKSRYSIYSLGAAGDDMADYFRVAEYINAITDVQPDFFLFSGGGNDLMGGHFDDYLNEYTKDNDDEGASRLLNERLSEKINQLMSIYESIFKEITKQFPSLIMIVHGYDYVIPKEGKEGRWLGKFMEAKNIVKKEDKRAVIKILIDTFNERLGSLSLEYENVKYLDLRGIVKDYQWHDEIHPNSLGFEQISLKYINLINEVKV